MFGNYARHGGEIACPREGTGKIYFLETVENWTIQDS